MNDYIESIYKSGKVTGQSGKEHPLHSEIDPAEGRFLSDLIAGDPTVTNTLEVGCAYGMSSLHICHTLRVRMNPRHTIIDPFQFTQWDGVGIRNLEQSGIGFFNLIQKKSEFAMPELLAEGEGRFDLVFVDGWHTFDHTLLDCFYATRLLRVGGYLVIDDVTIPPVRRAVEYFSAYPCYKEHAALKTKFNPPSWKRRAMQLMLACLPKSRRSNWLHPSLNHRIFNEHLTHMVALKKIGPDGRDWKWFPAKF